MNEFCFEPTPWEATLETLHTSVSAVRFLTLLEAEEEAAVEEAFQDLEDRHITLDISGLGKDYGTGETEKRLRREEQLVRTGLHPEALEENDPLRLYLQEIAGVPAAGDPQLLAQQYCDGDESVIPQLVNVTISRAILLAQEMTGRGVLLLDLMQEASLGLWQGILHYSGGNFEAHIDWWIRQYLAKIVTLQARSGGVGQKMRKALEDYRAADKRLLTQLGRNPTLEEIALEMQVAPEEAEVYAQMLDTARTVAKAKEPVREQEPEDDQAVDNTAYFQSRQRILDMLSTLSEQEAKVLTLRFGLEGALPCTPQETGRQLNLTAEQVVAVEAAALEKLRKT